MQSSGMYVVGSRIALLFLKEVARDATCLMNGSSRYGVGEKIQRVVIVFQGIRLSAWRDDGICNGWSTTDDSGSGAQRSGSGCMLLLTSLQAGWLTNVQKKSMKKVPVRVFRLSLTLSSLHFFPSHGA